MRKKILLILIIVGLISVLHFFVHDIISLDALKQNGAFFKETVNNHYFLSLLLFFLLYAITTSLALPTATILTFVAGFMFGTVIGGCVVITAATLGALNVFLGIRYLFHDHMQQLYKDKLRSFDQHIRRHGALYLLGMRLAAVFPFCVVNILAGLTSLPMRTYLWATCIGIIPGTFIYTYTGSQLGSINTVDGFFTTPIIISFVLLGLLLLLALGARLIQRYLDQKK